MANTDNQAGGDGQSTTWANGAVTAFQARTVTPSGAAMDTAENRECGGIVEQLNNDKNARSGSLTLCRPASGGSQSFGGSIVAQVNVGAKQW